MSNLQTQTNLNKAIIYTLVLVIGLVYISVFVQLLNAGSGAGNTLTDICTWGSLIVAIVGVVLVLDWNKVLNFRSSATKKEWIGLLLTVLSLALGFFALAS